MGGYLCSNEASSDPMFPARVTETFRSIHSSRRLLVPCRVQDLLSAHCADTSLVGAAVAVLALLM